MGLSPAAFAYVRSLVRQRAAIVLDDSKEYLVEARLGALARREGVDTVDALVHRLRAAPFNGLHRQVVSAMTTNETSFFRDVHPFEALRRTLLPELIDRRRAARRLTIWSAACSTGQEPYSVAMLLREHFPETAQWSVRIFATDLAQEVLERARAGVFTQLEVNRGLPAPLLVRYFRQDGTDWQITPEIRDMVQFEEMNLIEPWPALPDFDVVLLRNVLIYFDGESKQRVLRNLRQVLRPDGVLLMGGAETTLNLDDAYERLPIDRAGCFRLRAA
jgi:chemotaxis protein methyltransferase CheR